MIQLGGLVAAWLLVGMAGALAWADPAPYDELPEGAPDEVAQLYYSALALPDVADWGRERRLALLDAATLRYRDRLVDRAPWPSADLALRHVERLAASAAADGSAVAQACAQFGLPQGPCAEHAGYVRRVRVVEEMLAQGRLTLDQLEVELAGASRPRLGGPPLAQ
ncbi:MAG: hypothetical protein OXF68_02275 [Gammaproteobacteria bacterium]|nr:hypothetical protein [Gammaproteobacteria bacterium]